MENDITIYLPSEIHSTEIEYSQLFKAIQPFFIYPNETHFIFDFSKIEWIDANLLAVIGAAVEYRFKDCRISYLKKSISNKQADLWGRNGFGNYFKLNTRKRYDTTVDYKVFKADEAKKFGKYIDENLLNKNGLPELSPKLKKIISMNIQEIFGNAPMHGECSNVISCGQYFHYSRKLIFTIVDCGNTIEENVKKYFSYLNQPVPSHNIKWATVENHSTKGIVNGKSGGMGLTLLKEFIELNNGDLQICSGKEFWEYTNGNEICHYIDSYFPGTVVSIKINMDDRKSYLLTSECENIDDLF